MLWILCLLEICLLSFASVSESLRFHGYESAAYAIYEKWDARTNGTLEFYFRTHKRNGLLFYMDDLGKQQFMDLSLVDGRARIYLYFWDSSCYLKKEFIHGMFADSNWHQVTVRRNFEETIVKIDNSSTKVICKINPESSDAPYFDARSVLYVGAIPLYIPLNSISNPGAYWESYKQETRFEGCIINIRYNDGIESFKTAKLRETKGTSQTCNDACSDPATNKCQHKARCVDKIKRIECNCLGTGYEGRYCTEEATSALLNGSGYVTYDFGKDDHFLSSNKTFVAFRFLTKWESGIILHTRMETNLLVVEIAQGNVVVHINVGSGDLRLEAGNGALNDCDWHAVEIRRSMRNVTLSVDNSYLESGVTPGEMTNIDLVGEDHLVYIGGTLDSEFINGSSSTRNFSGVLQQFHFNNYKILDKVDQQNDEKFRKHGLVISGKLLSQIPTRTPTALTNPISGSGCPSPNDEDCTEEISTEKSTQSSTSRCAPGVTRCNSGASPSFGTITETTTPLKPTSQALPMERNIMVSDGRLLVPIWVVILVAVLCFIALCLIAFFVIRWNKRYSGSFNPGTAGLSPTPNCTDNRNNLNHGTPAIVVTEPFFTKV